MAVFIGTPGDSEAVRRQNRAASNGSYCSISGYVYDEDGAEVDSALMALRFTTGKGKLYKDFTAEDGFYCFDALKMGKYMISIKKKGCRSYGALMKYAGRPIEQDFNLKGACGVSGSVGGGADATAPTTTASPGGGTYTSAKTVTLTCADNSGGSGCSKTYYTTDGNAPTTSSSVYSSAVSISSTTTLKFFSVDSAGNQ